MTEFAALAKREILQRCRSGDSYTLPKTKLTMRVVSTFSELITYQLPLSALQGRKINDSSTGLSSDKYS